MRHLTLRTVIAWRQINCTVIVSFIEDFIALQHLFAACFLCIEILMGIRLALTGFFLNIYWYLFLIYLLYFLQLDYYYAFVFGM